LTVLLELGFADGRTGLRSDAETLELARAIHDTPHLTLAGLEAYEGAAGGVTIEERIAAVDVLLLRVRELTKGFAGESMFDAVDEIVVSAGGSLYFDRVAKILGPSMPGDVRVVTRSGIYFAHDVDSYQRFSPLAERGDAEDRLQPAMELWSVILSTPEPGLAIAGFGKRDSSYDMALPMPFALHRAGETHDVTGKIEVTALNDQHAFLRLAPDLGVRVGDLLGCGISHPCTAFDKWRLLPLVDDRYMVTAAIRTFF
jgi:D-serine dehydratase